MSVYKFVSWNVNGLRAITKKDDWQWLNSTDAHIIGLQETKASPAQLDLTSLHPAGWQVCFSSCQVKKGYSGVAVLYKDNYIPIKITEDLIHPDYQGEGRVLHLEYPEFHYFNIYFPNGSQNETRLNYKLGFYNAFLDQAQALRQTKPIVVGGDFNTAHHPIDLARPKANESSSGFLPIERAWLDRFTAAGYTDTFRHTHPNEADHYTWWSYQRQARPKNVGWRIDYFFVSSELLPNVQQAWIEPQTTGSDHCPVGLELKF